MKIHLKMSLLTGSCCFGRSLLGIGSRPFPHMYQYYTHNDNPSGNMFIMLLSLCQAAAFMDEDPVLLDVTQAQNKAGGSG